MKLEWLVASAKLVFETCRALFLVTFGNAAIDLEFLSAFGTTPIEKTNAIDKQPMHHTFGLPNAKIIAAEDPERSVLLCRVARRGPGQMPQLTTSIVNQRAVDLLREWIESIPPPAVELS